MLAQPIVASSYSFSLHLTHYLSLNSYCLVCIHYFGINPNILNIFSRCSTVIERLPVSICEMYA